MRSVGIREFRDKASQYLASNEVLAVKRHGKLVGLYIPVKESDEEEVQRATERLEQTIEQVIAESSLNEETLSRALNLPGHSPCFETENTWLLCFLPRSDRANTPYCKSASWLQHRLRWSY